MNRRLKNALKDIYITDTPSETKAFTKNIMKNAVWKKLHPVSHIINSVPFLKPAIILTAAAAAAAAGTGYIARDTAKIPENPPAISSMTDNDYTKPEMQIPEYTSAVSDIPAATETAVSNASTVPYTSASSETTTVSVTDLQTTASKTVQTSQTASAEQNHTQTSISALPETTLITAVSYENTTTTGIYYTHIFPHTYTEAESRKDNDVMFGYPDFGMFVSIELMDVFSEIISTGEITDISYTVIDGKPWTVLDVELKKVYAFSDDNIRYSGDHVKIYEAGGYMPLSQYIELNPDDKTFAEWDSEKIANTIIYEDGSNQHEPHTGDNFLFFLAPAEFDDTELTEKVYHRVLTANDVTQFRFDGEKYVSCNDYQKYSFTEEELLDEIGESHIYYSDPNSSRKILVVQRSWIFCGTATFYSVDENGKLNLLGKTDTDDSLAPFSEEYTVREENGCTVMEGREFSVIWTDSGIKISFRSNLLNDERGEIELDYPDSD